MSRERFGPQYPRDNAFTARMRFHQSWWRQERLGCRQWGIDAKQNPYGNYLTEPDARLGRNFLSPSIHQVAAERIRNGGGVEEFRCTRNLLSSQPMAFNLFAPLRINSDLAVRLLDPLLSGGVTKADVLIEWAPPRALHLGDATSFDVAVRYTTRAGDDALAAIETKLTEPFSKRTYGLNDKHTERYRAVAARSEVWRDPTDLALAHTSWNQIWRNHLLVESIRQSEPGLLGNAVVLFHPGDFRCAKAVDNYKAYLSKPSATFQAFSLDRVVATWLPLLSSSERGWLSDFNDRYLNLELSQLAWNEMGST